MPSPVTVPRLGWSMEEGTFGHWLKRDGDAVRAGDALFVLEGEKAAQDIESLDAGILRIPPDGPQPGQTVNVGQVLAFLVAAGEKAPFEAEGMIGGMTNDECQMTKAGNGAMVESAAPPAASPSVRRLARERGVDLAHVAGSGSGGRVTIEDVAVADSRLEKGNRHVAADAPAPVQRTHLRISPRARRAARDRGVDPAAIAGTGRHGRIRERDVVRAAASVPSEKVRFGSSDATVQSSPATAGQLLPLTPIRRAIAARMVAAVQQAAPVTLHTQIDATNLVQFRRQFQEAAERVGADTAADAFVPTYTALIVKLIAVALEQHRECLLQWRDDGLLEPDGLHIAVAVDTPDGLLAPVLWDVDKLTLRQTSLTLAQLTDGARGGRLRADQLQGGVFTVTNLGMYGIDQFTPVLNLPQSGILGVGRIRQEPAVVGDQVVPRSVMALSLTFDHRVVDGAPAARFLLALGRCLEQPGAWLMS